jgi:integral membrane protein (TIGR01906 family)
VALFLLLAAAGALAYTAWDAFFVFFHRVFFSGDSWLFAYSDTLIQLFPVDFWMDATWALVLPAILESLVLGALAGGALWRRSGLAPAGSTGTDVD